MDAIVKMLEKHQPFFEKISRNIYLQAIKDGFLGCMPIVLTSSIFLLIATLPGVVGITLPQPLIDWCNKLYNFTMGVMGIMCRTTAKNFTASHEPSHARRQGAQRRLHHGGRPVQHAAARCYAVHHQVQRLRAFGLRLHQHGYARSVLGLYRRVHYRVGLQILRLARSDH